jgi:hypothetical protein
MGLVRLQRAIVLMPAEIWKKKGGRDDGKKNHWEKKGDKMAKY